MDFEFNDDQEALRDSVRRYLADRAPIAFVRSMLDDERGTTDAVWQGLCDLGVTGLLAPEAAGGAGMGMVDAAVVLEEIGRALHPGPYASSAVGAVSLLTLAGSDETSGLVSALASGERVGTVALHESDQRYEWRTPTTAASGAGDAWELTGQKAYVTDACAADIFVVTAMTEDGLAVFVVDRHGGGVTCTSDDTVDGTTKRGTVTFDRVSALRLTSDDPASAVSETLDRVHTAAVVDGVGAASRALEMAVEYAKERKQFDVPVGSFQAVQHLCTDMLRSVELARAAAYYACWAADSADATERHRAATMALAFAADELYAVGASAIQVHAGVGYTWEHDVGLYYKRLLTLQQVGGGTVDQLEELATIALG